MRDGWRKVRVSDVAQVIGGGTPKTFHGPYWDGDIPWITPKDLSDRPALYTAEGSRSITEAGVKGSGAQWLPAGTVLLSTRAPIGYVTIAARPLTTNQGFKSLVLADGQLPEYWYYLLSGSTEYLRSRAPGSTFPELSKRAVEALEFALPPVREQRRIVDLMSHVDDALRSCDALVSAEGALLDAASEALVFSPEFPLMKVGDLAEGKRGLVGGPFGSSLVGRDYVETGVPVIRGQNLQGRYVSGDFVFVSEEKSRSLHGNQATPGDVVFTQRGTLGQVSLIPDDAYPNYVVSQSQMRLTPDRSIVSADWVYHAFRTPRMVQRIKRADTSTANPHINLGILRTMDVPIPSVDMQAQVCSQLNAIEASIVAKMAESEALKSTRGALLSALLGGTHQIPSSYDEFIRDEGAA